MVSHDIAHRWSLTFKNLSNLSIIDKKSVTGGISKAATTIRVTLPKKWRRYFGKTINTNATPPTNAARSAARELEIKRARRRGKISARSIVLLPKFELFLRKKYEKRIKKDTARVTPEKLILIFVKRPPNLLGPSRSVCAEMP